MAYETIIYERNKPFDKIATITLNRPDKLNALNRRLRDELGVVLDEVGKDEEIRVVILKGAGRAFCAGADMTASAGERPEVRPDVEGDRQRIAGDVDRFLKMREIPQAVIVQIHGFCIAGGIWLACFPDIAIIAEDTKFFCPRIPVGGGLISATASLLIGPRLAKELAFNTGIPVTARQMAEAGFGRTVPPDKLEEEVNALARSIARMPLPILRIKKQAINRIMDVQGFREAAHFGAEWDAILHYSDAVEECRTLIREKGMKQAIADFEAGKM